MYISDLFFLERLNGINGEIYRNECLNKKLMNFINKYNAWE